MNMTNYIESSKTKQLLFWVLCLGIGIFVRLWGLDHLSLRLDETQSVWQASHSLEFIRAYMLKNVHLPLHNSLLHFWIAAFGSSEIAVRVLAFIPGLLMIPAVFLLSSEIIGKQKSYLTAVFATLSPIWVWYSREIRMYTLLTLISILSYYFFLKILKTSKTKYIVFYTIINILGIYTHYFYALVIAVQGISYLLWYKFRSKTTVMLIGSWLFMIGAFIPWVFALIKNYGSGTLAPSLTKPGLFNIILAFFEFTNGFLPEKVEAALISLWPLIILLAFIFLTKRQNPFSKEMNLVLVGTFFPVYIVYLVSVLIRPMFLTRYLIIVTPMYYIFLSWYFNELQGIKKYVTTGLFLTIILASLYLQATHPDTPVNENYRDAVAYMQTNATPIDIIAASPPYTIYPLNYYYNGITKATTLPIWDKRKGGIPETTVQTLENDVNSLKAGHQKLYVLLTLDLDGAATTKKYLETHFKKIEKKQFSKYIWVEVYDISY